MEARAGFEPMTLQTKGVDSTKALPTIPQNTCINKTLANNSVNVNKLNYVLCDSTWSAQIVPL